MVKCGACGKFLSAAETVRCNKCNGSYHRACVAIPEAAKVKTWTCPGCKIMIPREDNSTTPVRGIAAAYKTPGSPPMELDDTAQNITEEKVDLALELRSFRSEMSALRAEVRECRLEIIDLKSALNSYDEKISTMESRISALEKKMEGSSSESNTFEHAIAELKLQLNDKDQELLSNDIDLSGVPEHNGENLLNIMKVLSVKLGVEYDERDFVRVERVGSTFRNRIAANSSPASGAAVDSELAEQRPRVIVVRFARQITRDQWINAARVRRGITSADIDIRGPSRRIYINERLTRTNRRLFYLARQARDRFQWRHVWSRNGRILARKADGQQPAQIRTENDIVKIFV